MRYLIYLLLFIIFILAMVIIGLIVDYNSKLTESKSREGDYYVMFREKTVARRKYRSHNFEIFDMKWDMHGRKLNTVVKHISICSACEASQYEGQKYSCEQISSGEIEYMDFSDEE